MGENIAMNTILPISATLNVNAKQLSLGGLASLQDIPVVKAANTVGLALILSGLPENNSDQMINA